MRSLLDIEQMPGYEFKEGFKGVRSVSEGKVQEQFFPMAKEVGAFYPSCSRHGAILLIARRQDGDIWRCRELGCDEGCFTPK